MSNGKYFFLTCQMLECCCFDGFHSFSRKFFTGQAMNCKEQRPSDYHLSHPYYLHLWTLDFYFYLMDNSLQPLEDHLLDKMLNFSLKFHSHSNLLGGVGHCFAWHVRVGLDFNFNFNFKTEELV